MLTDKQLEERKGVKKTTKAFFLSGEVCKELGICRATLLDWERREIITPKRIGPLACRVYDRAEVIALKRKLVKERRRGLPILASKIK